MRQGRCPFPCPARCGHAGPTRRRPSRRLFAMTKFGLAQPVRRVEDPRLLLGARALHRRYPAAGDVAWRGAAQPACRRRDHRDRHRGGGGAAGRARDLHRRRSGGRRDRSAALRGAADQPRRLRHGRPAASGAGARGAVRHVGDPVAFIVADSITAARDAAEAVAVEYDIAARDHRHRGGAGAGGAAGLARRGGQPGVRLGDRRQGGDRRAVRQGRACHAA